MMELSGRGDKSTDTGSRGDEDMDNDDEQGVGSLPAARQSKRKAADSRVASLREGVGQAGATAGLAGAPRGRRT